MLNISPSKQHETKSSLEQAQVRNIPQKICLKEKSKIEAKFLDMQNMK